uniref:Uncharacterized protein n=1 Tax=Marseillevirus sp. TaxID=2809551 RepID=A0AA96IYN8_9VIRU|nr:hypothetical protein MarDSR_377 [Marseillevirus sp.]
METSQGNFSVVQRNKENILCISEKEEYKIINTKDILIVIPFADSEKLVRKFGMTMLYHLFCKSGT